MKVGQVREEEIMGGERGDKYEDGKEATNQLEMIFKLCFPLVVPFSLFFNVASLDTEKKYNSKKLLPLVLKLATRIRPNSRYIVITD